MKKLFFLAAAVMASLAAAAPQRVILDTDIGNDVDDALALAMLYDYQAAGRADVAAVLVNKDCKYSPAFVSLMNDYYGFKFPIGMIRDGKEKPEYKYVGKICRMTNPDGTYKYSRSVDADSNVADSVKLARKVLAESADGGVVYISIGFSTNVARLFDSPADDISPLSGRDLVAKKVKYFSVMAGQFGVNSKAKKMNPEYNIRLDLPSAKKFVSESPVPIVFSGFEVGQYIGFPSADIEKLSPDNPVSIAYKLYARDRQGRLFDTRVYDLTSVLYVFSPEFFKLSEAGTVVVDDNAMTNFTPNANGKHRYMIIPENGGDAAIAKELSERTVSYKPKAER